MVIVDSRDFPRRKPCGDCLSAAATQLLRRLGLLDRVLNAGAQRLNGWRIVGPSGRSCTGRFGHVPALALERRVLDHVLLDAALDAGAEFRRLRVRNLVTDPPETPPTVPGRLLTRPGSRADPRVRGVDGRDPDGAVVRLHAGLVVGADGLRSVVARRLGRVRRRPRLRKVSLTTHVAGLPLEDGLGAMYVLDGGCFGFAPVGRGRFNVTLVVDAERARGLGDAGPAAFFNDWLRRVPALLDRIGGAQPEPFLASGPFDWPVRSAAAPGAALVGDAAGYYDPFTGQGVFQAMAGAEILAREVAPVIGSAAQDAAVCRYARAQRRLTRPARRFQHVIERILSRPRRADRVLARLAAAPAVMDRVVAVTGDLKRPVSLLSPRLITSFFVPSSPGVP